MEESVGCVADRDGNSYLLKFEQGRVRIHYTIIVVTEKKLRRGTQSGLPLDSDSGKFVAERKSKTFLLS